MKPEIREMKDLRVVYVRRTGNYNTAAGEAWKALCAYAGPKRLFGRKTVCLGIGHDDPDITPEDKLRYDACLSVGPEVKPEGEVGVQTIPAGKHAVFLHKGPYDQLGKTYAEIYGQWLPSSGAKLREAPCFEVYLDDPERTPPEKLRTEICVPIE